MGKYSKSLGQPLESPEGTSQKLTLEKKKALAFQKMYSYVYSPAPQSSSPKDSSGCQAEYKGLLLSWDIETLTTYPPSSNTPPVAAQRKISLPLDPRKGGPILLSEAAAQLAMSLESGGV